MTGYDAEDFRRMGVAIPHPMLLFDTEDLREFGALDPLPYTNRILFREMETTPPSMVLAMRQRRMLLNLAMNMRGGRIVVGEAPLDTEKLVGEELGDE